MRAEILPRTLPCRFVLLPKFQELTGYTAKAVYRKVEDGVWTLGRIVRKADDGRLLVDLVEFEKWVDKAMA